WEGMAVLKRIVKIKKVFPGIGRALPESPDHHGWFELVLEAADKREAASPVVLVSPIKAFVTNEGEVGFLPDKLSQVTLEEGLFGASAAAIREWTGSDLMTPYWNGKNELRVGGYVVKKFKKEARNQFPILDAFEDAEWPPEINDPLPEGTNMRSD